MGRVLHNILVTVLTAGVLFLAGVVTFCAASFFVLTGDPTHSGTPGSVRYETREFWLSLKNRINGEDEQWTAEWPDVTDKGSP